MSNRPTEPRPRYAGLRDSVTGEVLPPPNWERSGKSAAEFDSEKWLEENGYQVEKSRKKSGRTQGSQAAMKTPGSAAHVDSQCPPENIDDYIAYCIEQRRRYSEGAVIKQPRFKAGKWESSAEVAQNDEKSS